MARAHRFSLALGGGGARGIAHVGVLGILEREGLVPVAVAGTSMGAVVGSLYAAGTRPDEMAAIFDLFDLKGLVASTSLHVGPESVLSADKFAARLRDVLPTTFADLRMPFACVAVDVVSGERIVLDEGDLPLAVRASMAIPVVLEPVRIGEALLVDGGVVDPVPVRAARDLGGDPVVAVNVGAFGGAASPAQGGPGWRLGRGAARRPRIVQLGIRSFDIAQHHLAAESLSTAAVVIRPEVADYTMADFLHGEAIVDAGVRAAEEAVPAVRSATAPSSWGRLTRWLAGG